MIMALLIGALTWTFLEYVIHRWLGHDSRFRPNFFAEEHIRHHSQGNYFAPAWKKLFMAAVTMLLLGPLAWLVAGPYLGLAWAASLVAMYLVYEWFHHCAHTHAGLGPYARYARRHHFYHHFMDPEVNHGVTTPIWDILFGTFRWPVRIRVPEKLAMRWLVDSSGRVPERFSNSYELVLLNRSS